jgi:hypothetical protein
MLRRRVVEVYVLIGLCCSVACFGGCASEDKGAGGSDGTDGGSSGDGSVEWRICEAKASCGMIPSGFSVQDCVDDLEKCIAELPDWEKTLWEGNAEHCLTHILCDDFDDCYTPIYPCNELPDDGCAAVGDECEANEDCCDYADEPPLAYCVDFGADTGVRCSAPCSENGDCNSDCCAPLDGGESVCAPAEFCP